MSLVAWYPLIDGSLENKGLDTTPLTLHGTVPFTNGRVRTAPTFSANANNYYTMPPITKTNDFSICCWIKISADVSVSSWIVWQGVTANVNRFGFVYLSSTTSIDFRIGFFQKDFTIEKDKWYHLCMTMNDTNYVTCYINGNVVISSSYGSYSFTENEALYLGRDKNGSAPTNCQLQDFRYYDHCLSPKEVKDIAKGLCLHLLLKGTNARPNLFKNSATMFNATGSAPDYNVCTSSPALVFDENAPCGANGKILRATVNRPDNTVKPSGGYFWRQFLTNIPTLTIGQKYCVSVWARCTANNVLFLVSPFMEGHTFVKGSENKTLTSEWKRYYAIFIATKETSTTCFYISAPIGASGILEYCCPKLELLSPTPYIPNVDDTQYSDFVLDYEPDCSGNEFDATKHGDLTTSDSNGRYNTAIAFNGTNTYLQGLAPTNSECKEFTIATWVKLNNVSANQTVYACRTAFGQGVALFYLGANHGIRLDDGATNVIFSNSTLEPDKWYHIAVTRDTAERKLYINGNFVSAGATTGSLVNMGSMYQVGESNAQTGTPIGNLLNGSLSDFRLYTSVLSADDVKELYETSLSVDNDGNMHSYEFDEGCDQSIKKVGVMTSPKFTETTDVNMVKGNTNTTKLIEV